MILKRYGYELTEPCKCLTCDGLCTSLVPKKWFQCPPCAHGYHEDPCESFVQQHPAHIIAECGRCGFEKGEHGHQPDDR